MMLYTGDWVEDALMLIFLLALFVPSVYFVWYVFTMIRHYWRYRRNRQR
ncbi:hypothetical protein [Hymenobacter cellulosilyticus]|uniref:Uncharacterized protein n=1 Tax=Hymenobacter cellulosilyticus TaxID=2932248 RepID=A0A8T9QK12_9BACT|nr:hypothetical protein [Hymenobacter cellulosilyticus]UOQ75113.1 hypothetical protein MUN79_28990 [Hymenobacter cellulosilyticus]